MPGIIVESCDDRPYGPGQTDYEYDKWRQEEMELTAEQVNKNAHIPDDEILQDIADTKREIATMTREEAGFRLIGDRMSIFRADARRQGIKERTEFVEKLEALLIARKRS